MSPAIKGICETGKLQKNPFIKGKIYMQDLQGSDDRARKWPHAGKAEGFHSRPSQCLIETALGKSNFKMYSRSCQLFTSVFICEV